MANQFDVVILGGGPAGYVAAIRAAQLGMTVAVIEQEKLGGVCVNIGCIPTKALLHSAYLANAARGAAEFGVDVGTVKTDYGVAMKRSRKVSEQNAKGVEFLMKKHNVTVVKGTGTLQPGRKVKVGADVFEAMKAVIVATGSRVKGIPQIGLELNRTTVISSDEALFLEIIERAAGQDEPRNLPPIHIGRSARWLPVSHQSPRRSPRRNRRSDHRPSRSR